MCRGLTVRLGGRSFSLDDRRSRPGEPRRSDAAVLLLRIGFRRTGLCIFPGAVLGRDEPGCSSVNTHTHTQSLQTLCMRFYGNVI